jgi:hypothetical protein
VRRDLGDFQTPSELVAEVLDTLGPIGVRWPRVLEPTCGRGHFIGSLLGLSNPPREIQAIEIQEAHCQAARSLSIGHNPAGAHIQITRADLFDLDLNRDLNWREPGPLLVIGNPPWVTNSELGALGSSSRPPRRNLKGLRGIEARTGASNFDVAEAVWFKLVFELADQTPTIAILCKTSVARSLLQFAHRAKLPVIAASIHRIDAARWFGAMVGACLFQVTLGAGSRCDKVPVFSALGQLKPESYLGFTRGWLIADRDEYEGCSFADGVCPMTWRQGIKHDAAAVMELVRVSGAGPLQNGAGEIVDVESEFIYPLIKGTDLKRPASARPERAVVVTQKRIGDDTTHLSQSAPRLWSYLQAHRTRFDNRKSSIYRGQTPFALFGVGPYSFAPFKVAISGMHKTPSFHAVGPTRGRPVMFDDTCYFLACSTAEEAAVLTALCNDPATLALIRSASFRDAKRPVTKALLQRIDLGAILDRIDRESLLARAAAIVEDDLGAARGEPLSQVAERLKRAFSGWSLSSHGPPPRGEIHPRTRSPLMMTGGPGDVA